MLESPAGLEEASGAFNTFATTRISKKVALAYQSEIAKSSLPVPRAKLPMLIVISSLLSMHTEICDAQLSSKLCEPRLCARPTALYFISKSIIVSSTICAHTDMCEAQLMSELCEPRLCARPNSHVKYASLQHNFSVEILEATQA